MLKSIRTILQPEGEDALIAVIGGVPLIAVVPEPDENRFRGKLHVFAEPLTPVYCEVFVTAETTLQDALGPEWSGDPDLHRLVAEHQQSVVSLEGARHVMTTAEVRRLARLLDACLHIRGSEVTVMPKVPTKEPGRARRRLS